MVRFLRSAKVLSRAWLFHDVVSRTQNTITIRFKIDDLTLILSIDLKSSIADVALIVAKALSRSISEDDPSDLATVKADQLALWACEESTIDDPSTVRWTRLRSNDRVDKVLANGDIVGLSRIQDGEAKRPTIIVPVLEDAE